MTLPFEPQDAFAVFALQDSGCVSYGVVLDGERRFVKTATTPGAAASLARAARFHRAVQHPAIVAPLDVVDVGDDRCIGPVLVYPWCDGEVLHAATATGDPDRRALGRFREQPLIDAVRAVETILDAHLAVTAAGFVAVDLYDGCFLYDEATRTMRLIDLDEYRPGPFVVDGDRLPGSRRYMAPEELTPGATIDERTTVFNLGRTIEQLLDHADGWRGTPRQREAAAVATRAEPADRFATVADLVAAWA